MHRHMPPALARSRAPTLLLLLIAVLVALVAGASPHPQRSAISATHAPHPPPPPPRRPSVPTSSTLPLSASSSISNTAITTATTTHGSSHAGALPTHTITVNGTVTTVVGNATLALNALASTVANNTSSPTTSPLPMPTSPPRSASDPPNLTFPHAPAPPKSSSGNTLHGSGDKSTDGPNGDLNKPPLSLVDLGGKVTVIAMASIGGLLMVMASAGAIGMRRSPRRLLPPRLRGGSPGGGAAGGACGDLVDQFMALERSPIWLAWIARGMPKCSPRVDPAEAALAFALGVPVDEVARIRAEGRWRAIQRGSGTCVSQHQPLPQHESLARRVLRSTVSGWTLPSLGRRGHGGKQKGSKVVPVLARNGPVPPALEARELIRLRRRRSDAGKVSPSWEPPATGTLLSVVAPSKVAPPLPPLPVPTRAAVMRVGSDRGSMDTELSETYVAPRRKDLILPRHPTSSRPNPLSPMPLTTDHILHGCAAPPPSSHRHSSSSSASSSSNTSPPPLVDSLDPAMIVAEYGPVRLSPPPTQASDRLPDGRPRARSLPAGMLRYAAYMAAQRHAARLRKLHMRMARAQGGGGGGNVSEEDEEDDMGMGEEEEDNDKQVVDGEGNVIVAPVYRLPANRAAARAAVLKAPSVSTMRRGSASTATASISEAPAARGRATPATLAVPPTSPRVVDPDADTDIDAASSPAVSLFRLRSRATSISFSSIPPPPPLPATMRLPTFPSTTSTADQHADVDEWTHHEWHLVTPELAGTFPRRRASDVSTDLSSIIVVLEEEEEGAAEESLYDLDEIVVVGAAAAVAAAPAAAHLRSVSSPADPEWAVPSPAVGLEKPRTRSLSPPASRTATGGAAAGAGWQARPMELPAGVATRHTRGEGTATQLPPPPRVHVAKPWPAHCR